MAAIVFMGTPQFAVPVLDALARAHRVVGVVTQPDRPAGRGRQVQPSPVARAAREHGLPMIQPVSLRGEPEAVDQIRRWAPDVIAVAAFGQILKPEVLAIPPHGCLNVHASLLPRWRGAAPIAHAILAGDPETGVSIMQMEVGLDTGPVLVTAALPILPNDTAGSLAVRLAESGAKLLCASLDGWLAGSLRATPQDESQATLAPALHKAQGRLDWTRPAAHLARQVRAFDPWPGTFTMWNGRVLKVLGASAVDAFAERRVVPGEVIRVDGALAVGTGEGLLRLDVLQLEGKRAMGADEFSRGYSSVVGSVLESV